MKHKTIKESTLLHIADVLAVCIFISSIAITAAYFFSFNISQYSLESQNDSVSLPLDRLISGTSSGNLIQHITDNNNKRTFGCFCIKNDDFYRVESKNYQTYLLKSSIESPDSAYPILEGYDLSYINVVDNTIYFIGKPTGSTDKKTIYSLSTEGSDFLKIETEFKSDINSLVTNSSLLYFTVCGNPNIYSMRLDGTGISIAMSLPQKNSDIKLFSVDKTVGNL